jgi:hypothetical protein
LTQSLKAARAMGQRQRASKASAGVRTAHGCFSWAQSAERAALCLRELEGGIPVRLQRSRLDAEKSYRRFEAARRLLLDNISRRAAARGVREISPAT